MTMFFKTRSKMRTSTITSGKKVDLGSTAPAGKRWAIQF